MVLLTADYAFADLLRCQEIMEANGVNSLPMSRGD